MKFNVSSKILCNFAASVAKVINDKNALTILNNFYMELNGDILTLRGSNTENSLTAHIPVNEAQGDGAVCVDASSLVSMLKQIPDQGITVDVANSLNTTIEYSSGRFEFVALDGAGYPRIDRTQKRQRQKAYNFCVLVTNYAKAWTIPCSRQVAMTIVSK